MILRPRHMRAIELLASTDMLSRDIAKEVGVCSRTLTEWGRDQDFRDELARRRAARPEMLRALWMDAVSKLLVHTVRALEQGDVKLPLKEMVSLLGRLISKDFGAPRPEPAGEAEWDGTDHGPELSAEDIRRMWAEVEAQCKEAEKKETEESRVGSPSSGAAETPANAGASQPA